MLLFLVVLFSIFKIKGKKKRYKPKKKKIEDILIVTIYRKHRDF